MKQFLMLLILTVMNFKVFAETKISVNILSDKNRFGVELASGLRDSLKNLDLLSTRDNKPVMSTFFSVIEDEDIDCNTKGVIFNVYWVYESENTALPQIINSNVLRCSGERIKYCKDVVLGRTLEAHRQAEQLVSMGAL